MEYYKVLVFVALLFTGVIAEELDDETDSGPFSEPSPQGMILQKFEVPDSSLLLLDRMNFSKIPVISYRSTRKKQKPLKKKGQKQETTTIIPANVTTPSSEEEEDDGPSRPCVCTQGICKCCTGLIMDLFSQKACMKIAYHPGDFAFDVAMSWNDRVLYENSLSGKNPKPICIHPPRMNNLKVCAKFYNVFFPGRNFHFCLAMNGQWRSLELFNVAFDCLRMGANGIAMVKPEDAGGLVIPNPQGGVDAVIDSGDDIEDYDENVVKSLLDMFDRKK
ncbi:hypothetical protein O0L34_g9517 [Tuta absoluta]|nr:hypothetical protein O0L34_g9517 [Tuta absoluta]